MVDLSDAKGKNQVMMFQTDSPEDREDWLANLHAAITRKRMRTAALNKLVRCLSNDMPPANWLGDAVTVHNCTTLKTKP